MHIFPKCEDQTEKDKFIMKWQMSGDLQNFGENILGLENFNNHVRRKIDDFEGRRRSEGVHGE